MTPPPTPSTSPSRRIVTWFEHPTLNILVLAIIASVLALRKPWALTTPQLWAEDGSIFLTFNDLHGLHAFVEPYMGYLHTIPRIIAWLASHTVDPRWWPAFYNWSAFAIQVAVVARTFSPRLDVPYKPWLALAFLLGPHTGEILLTITNIQWFTGVLLIEQVIVAAPRTRIERAADFAIVILAGLTGPFIIAFWPLLAWRTARTRSRHDWMLLLVATVCALIQGVFVLKTGPHFNFPAFSPGRFLVIIGQHLFGWALVGDPLAKTLPHAVVAVLGLLPAIALLAAAFRAHPLRPVRLVFVGAFVVMTTALIYRSRPDTWDPDNLWFSERYFFIPRLMLFWLLILEFGASLALVRWGSRIIALLIAVVHLRHFAPAAPTDYHWAMHCDPIRRGVPANIPTLPEGWTLEYHGRPAKSSQ